VPSHFGFSRKPLTQYNTMAQLISRCIDNDVNKSIARSLSTGGTDALSVAFFMCTKDSANQTDEDKLVTLMNEHAKRTINSGASANKDDYATTHQPSASQRHRGVDAPSDAGAANYNTPKDAIIPVKKILSTLRWSPSMQSEAGEKNLSSQDNSHSMQIEGEESGAHISRRFTDLCEKRDEMMRYHNRALDKRAIRQDNNHAHLY
jgi:hypothetical protein